MPIPFPQPIYGMVVSPQVAEQLRRHISSMNYFVNTRTLDLETRYLIDVRLSPEKSEVYYGQSAWENRCREQELWHEENKRLSHEKT